MCHATSASFRMSQRLADAMHAGAHTAVNTHPTLFYDRLHPTPLCATLRSYPYMATYMVGNFACDGTLIAPRVVLSAGMLPRRLAGSRQAPSTCRRCC